MLAVDDPLAFVTGFTFMNAGPQNLFMEPLALDTMEPPSEVPLPGALPLFIAALIGFGGMKRFTRADDVNAKKDD